MSSDPDKAFEPQVISDAVVLWTGWGEAMKPRRDDQIVIDRFGTDRGHVILERVHELDRDFYKSKAYLTSADLPTMKQKSISDFQHLHPDLPPDIGQAFAWCYTFDYK